MTDETYNGWKNRETWNVVLWINNDEPLYRAADEFMRYYNGTAPYADFIANTVAGSKTPDGVAWDADTLDLDELNAMMNEFAAE